MPIHPKFRDVVKALAAPNADKAVVQDIIDSEDALPGFGVDTPRKAAHFLAQISHESGGFKIAVENMNYTAKRLTEVWPGRFPTLAKAQQYAGNPQKLANFVYANRMGNGPPASGDGFRYRGRGLIQITGRDMYQRIGQITNLDLKGHPELAERPDDAIEIAGGAWKVKKADQISENAAVETFTQRINGGLVGLADRRKRFAKATEVMGL